MKKLMIALAALLAFCWPLKAQTVSSFTYQANASLSAGFSATYNAATSSGTTSDIDLVCGGASAGCVDSGVYPANFTVEVIVTGSPSACTVAMNGSLVQYSSGMSQNNFVSLVGNQTCTSTMMFSLANTPLKTLNFTLTFSGGTSPTVKVIVAGKH